MSRVVIRLFLCGGLAAMGFSSCGKNNSPAGPFNIPHAPSNYLAEWGTYGSGKGQFIWPQGIAVNSAGTSIYLVDGGNNRVEVFTGSGAYLAGWGGYGTGPGEFSAEPGAFECIALNSSGTTVYAADTYDYRVEVFSPSGAYRGQWGTYGTGNGQFYWGPGGVAVNQAGTTIYVVDPGNYRIQVFNSAGGYLAQWPCYSDLYNTPDIVVNSTGTTLYVSTGGYGSVNIYSPTGAALGQVGSTSGSGSGNGQFNAPDGIALSPDNSKVYVVDKGNNRVEVFDSSGNYLSQFGSYGLAPGFFNAPSFIAVDGAGYLYVTDSGNNRVEKFSP
jgi:DNA-binding beta-propeller fold protein YncE